MTRYKAHTGPCYVAQVARMLQNEQVVSEVSAGTEHVYFTSEVDPDILVETCDPALKWVFKVAKRAM